MAAHRSKTVTDNYAGIQKRRNVVRYRRPVVVCGEARRDTRREGRKG